MPTGPRRLTLAGEHGQVNTLSYPHGNYFKARVRFKEGKGRDVVCLTEGIKEACRHLRGWPSKESSVRERQGEGLNLGKWEEEMKRDGTAVLGDVLKEEKL